LKESSVQEHPSLSGFLSQISLSIDPVVSDILDRALDGKELSRKDASELFNTTGTGFNLLMFVADEIRRRTVGNVVTYVVNRNINFTNICTAKCGFCAFSREPNDPDAYTLSAEEVAARAEEGWRTGATEVCIQGGLNPTVDGYLYAQICRAVKEKIPMLHIHAFSPMEIVYGAEKAGLTITEHLKMLKEAGLDSIPGTAAEILDDNVRRIICPRKINVQTWIDVVKTAHKLGIPTTSTIMYGHVDQPQQWVEHISLLRDIQKETHGFTEFIPLSFIHPNTPLYRNGQAGPGATGSQDIKVHAISRLMLSGYINNIQASWVKLGPKVAQICLTAGANDLGGTLMEENISRTAGATNGQILDPAEMMRLISDMGRAPAQRNTTYKILKLPQSK
jgi:FO synthase subunit 2